MEYIRPVGITPDKLIGLLVAGAADTSNLTAQAAVHLITGTGLPHLARFAEFVHVHKATAAHVTNWRGLATDREILVALDAGDRRLVVLAAGFSGQPIRLDAAVRDLSLVQARRVAEAFLIATGAGESLRVT